MDVPHVMPRTPLNRHMIWYDGDRLHIPMLGEIEGDETSIPLGINSMEVDVTARTSGKQMCNTEFEGGTPVQSRRNNLVIAHHLKEFY